MPLRAMSFTVSLISFTLFSTPATRSESPSVLLSMFKTDCKIRFAVFSSNFVFSLIE